MVASCRSRISVSGRSDCSAGSSRANSARASVIVMRIWYCQGSVIACLLAASVVPPGWKWHRAGAAQGGRPDFPGARSRAILPRSRRNRPMPPKPQPFTLAVPDAAIADLQDRLARTRLPDQAPVGAGGDSWAYGTSVAYLSDLIAHWREGFDWRAQEAVLNA